MRDSARQVFVNARLRMERRTCAVWVEALLLVAAYAIAFIDQHPKTYLMFVFALSGAVAVGALKTVVYAGASLLSFKFALFGMVAFLVIAFVLPLRTFTPVWVTLKKQGLSRYGALVSQHHLAFEARSLGGGTGMRGANALGSPDMSSLAGVALTRVPSKAILDSVKGLLL